MDADDVRALISSQEGTYLDFKEQDYDWSAAGKKAARKELAKDLMAMANALEPGQTAHILVGVREQDDKTGEVVGLSAHQDDADLHTRVQALLNRVPEFQYQQVLVDGMSVGVYTIRHGRRPYFPLRDVDGGQKGTLHRRVPLVRDGSSTDTASPDEVIAWARRDDPVAQELQAIELEKARRDVTPQAMLSVSRQGHSNSSAGFRILVQNMGTLAFRVVGLSATAVGPHGSRAVAMVDSWLRDEVRVGIRSTKGVTVNGKLRLEDVQGLVDLDAVGVPDWSKVRCRVAVDCEGLNGSWHTVTEEFAVVA